MKKVKYVILALVATMALVGSAFAYWSQTLYAQGNVSTGNLYIQASTINYFQGNDQCTVANCPTVCCNSFPYGVSEDQGVNAVAPVNVTNDNENNGGNANQLTFDVSSMWPGYWTVLTYKVANTGTVPWEFATSNPVTFAGVPDGVQVVAFNESMANFDFTTPNWWAKYNSNGMINATQLATDFGLNNAYACPPHGSITVGILVYMPYGASENDATMNIGTTPVTASIHVMQLTPGNGNNS